MVVAPAALSPLHLATAVATTSTSSVSDCNHNGVPDANESSWSNRDDDADGLCNSVDTCPYEVNPNNNQAACQMQAITVPADPANPTAPHVTYSGAQITLKGVARYGATQFRWDFGDGNPPMAWTTIANPYDLGMKHVYAGAGGQNFTATLSVGNGALGNPTSVATVAYPVTVVNTGSQVMTDSSWVDLRAQMATDDALWYLHTHQNRGRYVDGQPGFAQQYGMWAAGSFVVDDNCVVGDAFEQHGSLPAGSYDTDPYVEDVQRVLNFVLANSTVTSIGIQQYGDPDVNGNGLGIAVGGGIDGSSNGGAATCLSLLADSGASDRVAGTGANHVYGRSFADIGQDAVDWFAWGQNEAGVSRGNWGYQPNDELPFVDAGYVGLVPLALGDAEAGLGARVPVFLRTELPLWLAAVRNTSSSPYNGSWGDSAPSNFVTIASAGAGMIAEEFLGKTSTDTEVAAATGYVYRHWFDNNSSPDNGCWQANLGDSHAMWPITLGLMGANTTRVTEWNYTTNQATANSFDWYYSPAGQPQPGYAGNLISRQQADGSWTDSSGCGLNSQFAATAEGTMILAKVAPRTIHLNHSPAWQSPTPAAGAILDATPGSPLSIDVAAADQDTGDVVTLTAATAPPDATFTTTAANSATGTLTWTPPTARTTLITFTATDSHGTSIIRSITINATKKSPTIDWPTPAAIVYGTALDGTQLDAALSTAPGTRKPPHDGSFTYTPGPGTVLGTGDNALSVTWSPAAADAPGWSSTTATVTLHVNQASQTLSFTPPIDDSTTHTFGDAPFSVTATSDAGLPVTYSLGTRDACTSTPQADGSTVVAITGAGSCTLSADQPGNANYSAAPTISHSFTLAKQTPAITLAPADTIYGVPLGAAQLDADISPSGAAGNGSISYTVDGNPPPSNGILSAGTHTLTAAYVPDATTGGNYNSASTSATFSVAQAEQAITFPVVTNRTFGDDAFAVTATIDSHPPVSFTSQTTEVCAATSTGTVSVLHAGTCTVAADQTGDTNYLAAPTVTQSFTVAKAPQRIGFTTPGDQTYLDPPVALSAAGGESGSPVTFSAGPDGVCSADGSNLTIHGAGTCTIVASQLGNDDYRPASDNSQTITIHKATPAISWSTPNPITYGTALGAAQLNAAVQPPAPGTFTYTLTDGTTAASGAVLHASDTPQTLKVTFSPASPDDANFTSATSSSTILVTKTEQAIHWTDVPAAKTYGDAPFSVSATGGRSGNAVTFSAEAGSACTVSGSTVSITGEGPCVLDADQAGNGDYNAAPTNTRSVTVAKQTPTIAWDTPSDIVYGTPLDTSQLNATVSPDEAASSGAVAYTTDASSGEATGQVLHAGTHTLTATYTPSANGAGLSYTAVTKAVTLTVRQASQRITGFATITPHTYGDTPITLSATGGDSVKPVRFTVSANSGCVTSGTNGTTLTLAAAGTCTVVAHQDGNADYSPATDVSQTFQILQAPQTIHFVALPDTYVGNPVISLSATGGDSANPVTFTAGPSATCTATVAGWLTIIGPGTCTVTAYQAGNSNYLAQKSAFSPRVATADTTKEERALIENERFSDGWAEPVVSLCEEAAAAMRMLSLLTHHNETDAAPSPSQAHRALTATSMLLDRTGQVLTHVANGFSSQVDLGLIEMDPGTLYEEDLPRASHDLHLLVADATIYLDVAQLAVERALVVLAPARLRHASCA
jgi:hypothetical protein